MSRRAKTKQELVESIQLSYQDLIKKYKHHELRTSVKDILAHLVDWEQRFINWYHAGIDGKTPETPARGYTWRELPRLNQSGYENHKDDPLEDVLQQSQTSYREIFNLIQGMSEEEIFEINYYTWTGRSPLLHWIAGNTSSHYVWARRNIRTTVIRKGCPGK